MNVYKKVKMLKNPKLICGFILLQSVSIFISYKITKAVLALENAHIAEQVAKSVLLKKVEKTQADIVNQSNNVNDIIINNTSLFTYQNGVIILGVILVCALGIYCVSSGNTAAKIVPNANNIKLDSFLKLKKTIMQVEIYIISMLATSFYTIVVFGTQDLIKLFIENEKLVIELQKFIDEYVKKQDLIPTELWALVLSLAWMAALVYWFFDSLPPSGATKGFTSVTNTNETQFYVLKEFMININNTYLLGVHDVLANSTCNQLGIVQYTVNLSLVTTNKIHLNSIKDLFIEYTQVLTTLISQTNKIELDNTIEIVKVINDFILLNVADVLSIILF